MLNSFYALARIMTYILLSSLSSIFYLLCFVQNNGNIESLVDSDLYISMNVSWLVSFITRALFKNLNFCLLEENSICNLSL